MEIQDAKQARPHCELIAELLDSRQPKTEREHAAVREIERLRHDIERHIAIASEYATECERLRAENAKLQQELTKGIHTCGPTCRKTPRCAEMADLRAELAACAAALPGVYYMDSPDGGDVSVSEQLRRMAKDAGRYRLLRRKFAIISDGEGHAEFCALNLPRPTYIAPSSAIELDTALDRERLGLDGVRPPTPVGWSDTDWIKRRRQLADRKQ